MKDITISLMEINELQESARVLSIAMLDAKLHIAVLQGNGENERREIENMFGGLFKMHRSSRCILVVKISLTFV